MCHIFWHSVEISAGSAKLCCIGTSCTGSPPRKTFPTDKFSNKFQHFTKQNIFVAQTFLGHKCLRQHRCVRGQRVMLSHSMEISASLTKLFCWLGKSVQPLPSDAIKTSKEISQCHVPNNTRQTKAYQQRQHLWHKDSWDTTVEDYTDVPMSGSQGTCPNGQPLGSSDSGPVSGSTCLSSSTACLVNRLDKTTLLTWETVHICKFNKWYLHCHAGDEISNCITKTCSTKLLGTPLLKTHRRVSAKCVTYSGTAWKFQQAQRSSAALGRRVQVFLPKNTFPTDKFSNKFQHLT